MDACLHLGRGLGACANFQTIQAMAAMPQSKIRTNRVKTAV